MSGVSNAQHQFLKLKQPILRSSFPEDKVLEAGQTHEFRFLFVVPPQLLSSICKHDVASHLVHQEHTRLLPSLGDKSISGRGDKLLDDLAPDSARVNYYIHVTLREVLENGNSTGERFTRDKQKVRILPFTEESPPVNIEGPQSDYVLKCEKAVSKGLLKGKLGQLTIEAEQPRALKVPAHDSNADELANSLLRLDLRFDPEDATCKPPKLGMLYAKIKVNTFFSNIGRKNLPAKYDKAKDGNLGLHSKSVTLANRSVANVEWTWNPGVHGEAHGEAHSEVRNESQRRGSQGILQNSRRRSSQGQSQNENRGRSSQVTGHWSAFIVVSWTLPGKISWIPTFHSCLMSRSYALDIILSYDGAMGSKAELRLPLQLVSEGRRDQAHDDVAPPSIDDIMMEDETNGPSLAELMRQDSNESFMEVEEGAGYED